MLTTYYGHACWYNLHESYTQLDPSIMKWATYFYPPLHVDNIPNFGDM